MRLRLIFWCLWLLFAAVFSVRFIFADGEPCYDCQNCWQNIINCATNGGGNCSSNCVKLSPVSCSNLVDSITNQAIAIIDYTLRAFRYLERQEVLLDSFEDQITNVNATLLQALVVLDNFTSSNSPALSSVLSSLQYSHDAVVRLSNYWHNVDGSTGALFVSNLFTSVVRPRVPVSMKVSALAASVLPRLSSAISTLTDLQGRQDYAVNELASVRQFIITAQDNLDELIWYTDTFRSNVRESKALIVDVPFTAESIISEMQTVDCEPCGGGSGGTGGSGGGGTVDFTSISAKLDEIKTLLQQVYDLIYYYYSDYNTARSSRPSGNPTAEGYAALGNNWFERIEYLLYSSSPIVSNNLAGTESPDTIEGQTQFENETSQLEESVDSVVDSFDESMSRPWQKFSEHFSQFWDRFNAFKLPVQSSGQLGQLEWSHLEILRYEKNGDGFTLTAESDLDSFPSVWYKFAVGFRLLWFLLLLLLYCLFFIFMIKYSFKVAAFVTKLLNTSFGSG